MPEETPIRPAEPPKLEDVATLAGVSTATVSRCLNAPDQVAEKTRARVQDAVRTLGYAPNFGAQALAAKRTNTFGAVVPTMDNAIFAGALQAFQEELEKNGITLLVAASTYSRDLEEDKIRTLIARGADALLLIGHDRKEECYELLTRRGIPYIVTWAHDPTKPHRSVGFDNKVAMRALANKVLDLGHQRIGMITAETKENDRARGRLEGVRAAMADHGLNSADLSSVETQYTAPAGAQAFRNLMELNPRPTVVMCGNDVMAAGALRAAADMGLKVPQDVSVTGFDDIDLAEIVTPALTTIHVPDQGMGRHAARVLIAARNEDTPIEKETLETTIKWRSSLGPPPTQ